MTSKQEPTIPSEDWGKLAPEARAMIQYLRKKPEQRGPEPDKVKAEAAIMAASDAVRAEYNRLSGRASRGKAGGDAKSASKSEESFKALFGTTGGTAQSFILRLDQTKVGHPQKASLHNFGARKVATTTAHKSGHPFVGFNRAGGLRQLGIHGADLVLFGSHHISGFILIPNTEDGGDLFAIVDKANDAERALLSSLLKREHWMKTKPNDAGAFAVSDSVEGPKWAEDANEHALELQALGSSEKLSGWTAERLAKLAESAFSAAFIPVTQVQVSVGNGGVTFASQSDLMAALNALRTYVPKANAAAADSNLPGLTCLSVPDGYRLMVGAVEVGVIPPTNILATIAKDYSAVTAAISKLRHDIMSLSRDPADSARVKSLDQIVENLLDEAGTA